MRHNVRVKGWQMLFQLARTKEVIKGNYSNI